MRVKDIMTKDVITIGADAGMGEVAKILTEKRIHGLPVVENNRVVGIVTETDFFVGDEHSLYLPSFIEFVNKFKLADGAPIYEKEELRGILEAKVSDIMTKGCVSVDPESELGEMFEVFKKEGFHTIPVIDKDKNLCGIVTLSDIISLAKL